VSVLRVKPHDFRKRLQQCVESRPAELLVLGDKWSQSSVHILNEIGFVSNVEAFHLLIQHLLHGDRVNFDASGVERTEAGAHFDVKQ